MLSRPLILLALLFCCQAAPLHADPGTDNLASAPTLHDDSSGPEAGTTVGATMEAGEPFPAGYSAANYQGTVWWKWTPASPGWYEVNTAGSAIDTVLAVWSGTDYTSPLTPVHVNDEAAEGSVSRIRFQASNSVSYKIAVASKSTRGAVFLKAFFIPDPFSKVPAPNAPFFPEPTFTPSPANVANAVVLTARVRLLSGYEIESGLITLYSPSNTVLATASVSAANRNPVNGGSGSVANGVYQMLLTIPQDSPVGSCRWGISVSNATFSVTSSYGWEGMTPLPAGATASINLTNSYAAWLTANSMSGPDSARDADYDKDGLKNLIELASGTDPRVPAQQYMARSGGTITSVGLPVITAQGAGDQTRLRVEFARRLNDSSLTYTVQFSDDLVNWTTATNALTVLTTNTNLGYEAVGVEDEIFVPARPHRFGRVRVVQ